MTTDRFREILELLEWSPRTLARVLGIHETGPRKMASGKTPIPENLAAWLESIAAGPPGWRKP